MNALGEYKNAIKKAYDLGVVAGHLIRDILLDVLPVGTVINIQIGGVDGGVETIVAAIRRPDSEAICDKCYSVTACVVDWLYNAGYIKDFSEYDISFVSDGDTYVTQEECNKIKKLLTEQLGGEQNEHKKRYHNSAN